MKNKFSTSGLRPHGIAGFYEQIMLLIMYAVSFVFGGGFIVLCDNYFPRRRRAKKQWFMWYAIRITFQLRELWISLKALLFPFLLNGEIYWDGRTNEGRKQNIQLIIHHLRSCGEQVNIFKTMNVTISIHSLKGNLFFSFPALCSFNRTT